MYMYYGGFRKYVLATLLKHSEPESDYIIIEANVYATIGDSDKFSL